MRIRSGRRVGMCGSGGLRKLIPETGQLPEIRRSGFRSYTGSLFVGNMNIGPFIKMASSTPAGSLVLGVPKRAGYNINWP